MPLGKENAVIVLLGSMDVDVDGEVTGVSGPERSSSTPFGGWEKGREKSVAVRVGVAALVSAPVLVGTRPVIIRVAGGAGGLGVVRTWTAGGRAVTRE